MPIPETTSAEVSHQFADVCCTQIAPRNKEKRPGCRARHWVQQSEPFRPIVPKRNGPFSERLSSPALTQPPGECRFILTQLVAPKCDEGGRRGLQSLKAIASWCMMSATEKTFMG